MVGGNGTIYNLVFPMIYAGFFKELLPPTLAVNRDLPYWEWSSSGNFSAKSAYQAVNDPITDVANNKWNKI